MLKGISQSRRDNAWHSRNTLNKAKKRISHQARILLFKAGNGYTQRSAGKRAEAQYKEAHDREGLIIKVGLWGRVVAFVTNLFKTKTYGRAI